MNGWLQIFLSCMIVFINVFVPPRPYYNMTMTVVSWQQRQHIIMITLYELLMILSSIVTCPPKRVTIIIITRMKKISSRPFCPSLSHLSAVHQPCACDCTECVEEMTCHISQHTRPTRNIKYTSQQLTSSIYKNKWQKFYLFINDIIKFKCHWLL